MATELAFLLGVTEFDLTRASTPQCHSCGVYLVTYSLHQRHHVTPLNA